MLTAVRQFRRTFVRRRTAMPLIQVSVIKGVFSAEQKTQMISRLTDAMVTIEGENMRAVTWVKVDEIESGDWGIGGQALTTEAVKALAAGKTPVAAG
jgi:4-oxalocrotonate tautomerase